MNNNSDAITTEVSPGQVTSDTTKGTVNKVEPTKSVVAVAELDFEEQNGPDNPSFVLGYN